MKYEKLFSKRSNRTSLQEAAAHFKRIQEAAALLGNPQNQFSSIHVAGTNGKGSVATKIAKTLESSGYKVGLFTSPHLVRFEERIQFNGKEIEEKEVLERSAILMGMFPRLYFFDFITLLAFQFFQSQKVDVAVIEAGIGGRFDPTNLIHPLLSVITSVALDHTELLGLTVEEIAYQKAGIIKPNTPVVIGPKADFQQIHDEAKLKRSPLVQVAAESPDYDLENQSIAACALDESKKYFTITRRDLLVKPPCRFERMGRFILDVAHNPAGIESLLNTWEFHYPNNPVNVLVALSKDKDLRACLKLLAARSNHLFLVQADSKRGAPVELLKEIVPQAATSCFSIQEGIEKALACEHDILVCGTFYLMKEVREYILRL